MPTHPLNRSWRAAVLLTAFSLPALAPVQAAVFLVGPATDPACTHQSIQAAVNTAAQTPGGDVVQVVTGTWNGERIVINDNASLHLEGGYQSCTLPIRTGVSTLSGEGANPSGPVVRHNGPGPLTLRNLVLTRGNAAAGGGLLSESDAAVTLSNVVLLDNHANFGGGMAALGSGTSSKQVRLNSTVFRDNVAALGGGGLYLAGNADTVIGGNPGSYFTNNRALGTPDLALNGGGGIHASNSRLSIESPPPPDGHPFMSGNFAASHGGAIKYEADRPGFHFLILANQSVNGPLRIVGNEAATNGGAIYVRSGGTGGAATITATLFNAIVSDNSAANAGAFYIQGDPATGSSSTLTLQPGGSLQPAPACPANLRCNRVDSNLSTSGSTVYLGGGGRFVLDRGHMLDNASPGATGGLIGGAGLVSIDNSVLAGNAVGDMLVSALSEPVNIQNSTIAWNAVGSPRLFVVNGSSAVLMLHNSIAFQPGKQIHQTFNGATVNLRNLLVGHSHNVSNPDPINVQMTADPLFAGPGQNDFRLQPASPAINRYGAGGGVALPAVDLLGADRPIAPPGTPTPYDFGAYEHGAVVDNIFTHGFEF